jgi:hypothetical protein
MKKFFAFFLMAGFISTFCLSGQTSNWVKTTDGQVNCKKVSLQGETVKVVLENGEKQTLPVSSVVSFFADDKLYIKMPVQTRGEKKEALMEFVKTRDDMSLYKLLDKGNYRYLVYKGNEMYVELLDGNRAEFVKFFYLQ